MDAPVPEQATMPGCCEAAKLRDLVESEAAAVQQTAENISAQTRRLSITLLSVEKRFLEMKNKNHHDHCRIVIADDDDLIVKLLTYKFSQKGIEVVNARDGESALSLVASVKPDLVILDGMMPGMDGMEVLRRLKQAPDTKDIPIVFLSARKMEGDIISGLNLGAADYLVKPFMPEELYVRVKRLLGNKCKD